MKSGRRIWNTVTTVLVILVVLLAVLLVGVRLIGLTPYTVLSGSMEPTYHVGSLIYVKSIDQSEVAEGMPITYVLDNSLTVVTHRVTAVEVVEALEEPVFDDNGERVIDEVTGLAVTKETRLEEPEYFFTTKGDANESEDGAKVFGKNVLGTPVFSLPYLGYMAAWLKTRQGMIMGSAIAIVILLLVFVPDLIKDDKKDKKTEKKSAE